MHQSSGPNYPCPNCRNYLRFIHQYNQWWCDRCRIYPYSGSSQIQHQPHPQHTFEQVTNAQAATICNHCGNTLEFVSQYNQWWCARCRRYSSPSARIPERDHITSESIIGTMGLSKFKMRGDKIYASSSYHNAPHGVPLFKVRGDKIYTTPFHSKGMGISSKYKIRGNKIYASINNHDDPHGVPLYRIRGKRIYKTIHARDDDDF